VSVAPGNSSSEWSDEEERAGKLLNDEFAKMLDIQRQAGSATDTKAGIVAAAALTGAQFLAGQKNLSLPLGASAFAVLALTAGLAYLSLRIRGFQEIPAPRSFYNKYRDAHPTSMLFQLAVAKRDAYEYNRAQYFHKAQLQNRSVIALAVAAALGAAARLAGG